MSRKRCRMRVRSRRKMVLTPYNQKVALFRYEHMNRQWGTREFRTILLRTALQHVAAGDAEPVVRQWNGVVQVVGYQALKPIRAERPSPTTLTFATMTAVGNATTPTAEDPKYRLTRREQQELDKFIVWPIVGDTKAVAVRPRMTAKERALAEETLFSGGRRKLQAGTSCGIGRCA